MTALTALLLYVAWTLLLAISYASYRVPLILTGRKSADHWERGRPADDPPILQRAKGAHLNCVENLPAFAAVVLAAAALGKSGVVDPLAAYVLYARLAQSGVHILGTRLPLIGLRAVLFITQVALLLFMSWQLLH